MAVTTWLPAKHWCLHSCMQFPLVCSVKLLSPSISSLHPTCHVCWLLVARCMHDLQRGLCLRSSSLWHHSLMRANSDQGGVLGHAHIPSHCALHRTQFSSQTLVNEEDSEFPPCHSGWALVSQASVGSQSCPATSQAEKMALTDHSKVRWGKFSGSHAAQLCHQPSHTKH